MNVKQIKDAVDAGNKVCWKHDNYEVIKGKYEYLIQCVSNKHCIRLTHTDEITLNGDEDDFYIDKEDSDDF